MCDLHAHVDVVWREDEEEGFVVIEGEADDEDEDGAESEARDGEVMYDLSSSSSLPLPQQESRRQEDVRQEERNLLLPLLGHGCHPHHHRHLLLHDLLLQDVSSHHPRKDQNEDQAEIDHLHPRTLSCLSLSEEESSSYSASAAGITDERVKDDDTCHQLSSSYFVHQNRNPVNHPLSQETLVLAEGVDIDLIDEEDENREETTEGTEETEDEEEANSASSASA